MGEVKVPKTMTPAEASWAYRYGVAWARYSVFGDASAIRRHGLAYTVAPRRAYRLADRVRVVATKRFRDRLEGE